MGLQLYQLASGLNGLPLGCGVTVEATEAAIRNELKSVFEQMRGKNGDIFRKATRETREVMRRSLREGSAREAMLRLSMFFRNQD